MAETISKLETASVVSFCLLTNLLNGQQPDQEESPELILGFLLNE